MKKNTKTFSELAENIIFSLYIDYFFVKDNRAYLDIKRVLDSEDSSRYALPYLIALSQYNTTNPEEIIVFENIYGQKEDYTPASYLVAYLEANLEGCENVYVMKNLNEMIKMVNA